LQASVRHCAVSIHLNKQEPPAGKHFAMHSHPIAPHWSQVKQLRSTQA
jgi:hypothetical protein